MLLCVVVLPSHSFETKKAARWCKLFAVYFVLFCHWLEYVDSGIESEKRERERQLGKERKRGEEEGEGERDSRFPPKYTVVVVILDVLARTFLFSFPHFASRQCKKTWRRELGSLGTKPLAHMQCRECCGGITDTLFLPVVVLNVG